MRYCSIYCDQCKHCINQDGLHYGRTAMCDDCKDGCNQEIRTSLKKMELKVEIPKLEIRPDEFYKQIVNSAYGVSAFNIRTQIWLPSIKQVIFNSPATIVIWSDDVKTVVKAHDEHFDPEKGLAMAITKRALGNKGNYNNTINKYVNQYYQDLKEKAEKEYCKRDLEMARAVADELKKVLEKQPYRIWYRVYEHGKIVSSGMSLKEYKRKGNATAAAKKKYGDMPHITWVVSQTNPWGDE